MLLHKVKKSRIVDQLSIKFVRMKSAYLHIIGIAIVVWGSSCMKLDEYPNEPKISLENFSTADSGATLLLNFTDGDGNFGLEQTDTTGVFSNCKNRYNIFCEYYEKQNNVWQHIELDPCLDPDIIPFYYRAPFASPLGQYKAQKGSIELFINPLYYLPSAFDTCKFQITIMDRALNLSNTVWTPEYLKPS
ncbi:MAG: hypothetical protein RL521_938 [Bacteroidota bacterium]